MTNSPKIENAPGLSWKPRKNGWEARWQARADLVERGYFPKSARLWCGKEPTENEREFIATRCNVLQTEMLVWGRGGIKKALAYDGTVKGLVGAYRADKDSPYHKVRFRTRQFYDSLCDRLVDDIGVERIADLTARKIIRWNEEYIASGKLSMGHAVIKMLRIIVGFGMTFLEDDDCAKLAMVLKLRFKMAAPRTSIITAEQAEAIRSELHRLGYPSIALAQAFQFECMFRQKDVIGEWVPVSEPGISGVVDRHNKWLRGIRWDEIDNNFILTHVTSKRQKEITIDLKLAGMVMEELGNVSRSQLQATGPIIIDPRSGVPFYPGEFRRIWRLAADNVGIPSTVRNMDSRAGAVTEATEAGADLEHIKQAATHSDISMTQRYARGAEEKTRVVMEKRAEFRKNKG